MKFLSPRALYGLQSYKYKSGGYTYLDSLHNPLWNYVVELLPTWLAPNLITLLGAGGIFCAYAANIVYTANFMDEAPSWVYMLTAASIVLYINLDCVDGKQARRTKTSSPLGQLFDHGVDALVLHMMLANISASLGVSCGWKMAAGCLGIMVPWVLAQWEEYHSGIMMYGTQYYGVLEANYCICTVHIISAVWGLSFWRALLPLPEPLVSLLRTALLAVAGLAGRLGGGAEDLASTWSQRIPSHVSVADAALLFVSTAGIAQGLHNVVRVLGGSSPKLPKEEEGHKQLGRRAAALQLLLLVGTTVLGGITVALPSSGSTDAASPWQDLLRSSLGLKEDVIDAASCRFSFSSFGLLYALMATQLIIAHMAKEPFVPCHLALGCFGATILNILVLHIASPSLVVLLVHTLALAGYLIYTTGVIGQICEHLGINCLTIKPTKDA